ncbi:BT4734/BF3469 family protein [Pontibacter ummariensis]|nr:BT4734/BF3469 family protein [Pontibacter ummariensis]
MDTQTHPAAKEFYKYTFKELCQERGEALALEKVAMYQQPIYQHLNCTLLATYQNPSPAPEPSLLSQVVSVFYAPATNTTWQKQMPLHNVVNLIRSEVFKHETNVLRATPKNTTGKRKDCPNSIYKRTNFSYATFSGTFTYRDDKGLAKHSGLICIDIDHLGERLEEVRAKIIEDLATVVCFISPNGDGLKVLYEMDISKHSQYDWYEGYRQYLARSFGLEMGKLDSSCKNVSRACFLPHDPNIFVNPHFVTK